MNLKFLSVVRVAQIFGLPFVFVSLTTAAYFNLPQQLNNQLSGLMNFSRNLGGSVLISLSNAFVTESQQLHRTNVLKHMATSGWNYQENLQRYSDQVQRYVGPRMRSRGHAAHVGHAGDQVSILSYVDVYYLLGYMSLVLYCLTFVLNRNDPSKGVGGHSME